MNKIKVKICGVRRLKVAQAVIKEGADFLGFNFVKTSKRYIDPKDAEKISNKINGAVPIVGVFQNAQIKEVLDIYSRVGLDFVQLHGQEGSSYIKQLNLPVIKAVNVDEQAENIYFPSNIKYMLLDIKKGQEGTILNQEITNTYVLPTFIAGGINEDNVFDAIAKFSPFGVDVARGIETDGKGDVEKIRKFVRKVKFL